MKKHTLKLVTQKLVFMILIAVMVLTFTACGAQEEVSEEPAVIEESASTTEETAEEQAVADVEDTMEYLGEGDSTFAFEVITEDEISQMFEIKTDADTVGEALLELELIAGDDSEYGLYVKTVNGVTIDPDTEGKYWAFYINGEMAPTGVDTADIEEGATYTLAVETF